MDKEEISTIDLAKKKDQLSKKLVEIRELVDSVKSEIDLVGEEENDIWYSKASKSLYNKFSNDYRTFSEFDDSFRTIVDFLDQVCTGYDDLNQQILDHIAKLEDTEIV